MVFCQQTANIMRNYSRLYENLLLEKDLSMGLVLLESHLDGMLERVHQNSIALKRFQRFEMGLLGLNTLAEMIEYVLSYTQSFFELDHVSFCLIDENAEISRYLVEDRYDYQNREGLVLLTEKDFYYDRLGLLVKPYLGNYRTELCEQFFSHHEQKPVSVAILPLNRRGRVLGSLNLGSFQEDRFSLGMATDFIEHMISVISICLENNLNFETMRRTTLIDTLTGVNNRFFWEQRIDEELDRSNRNGQPLTCLFLDIDWFKKVNDEFGHQAGDYVLAEVAGAIKRQLRSNDVLARYGGEEFVALLSNIDENRANEISERIRLAIDRLTLSYNDQPIPVTISIGSASYQPDSSFSCTSSDIAEALIKKADSALYLAKENGRNRIENGGRIAPISRQLDHKIA